MKRSRPARGVTTFNVRQDFLQLSMNCRGLNSLAINRGLSGIESCSSFTGLDATMIEMCGHDAATLRAGDEWRPRPLDPSARARDRTTPMALHLAYCATEETAGLPSDAAMPITPAIGIA